MIENHDFIIGVFCLLAVAGLCIMGLSLFISEVVDK